MKVLVTLVALAAWFPDAVMSQAGPTPIELVEQYERIGLLGGVGLARQVAGVKDPVLLKRLEIGMLPEAASTRSCAVSAVRCTGR